MGKIYEALEQAQRERAGKEKYFPDPPPGNTLDTPSEPSYHREMAILYQHIDSLLGGSPKKVIQFIAAREGEGTSTIVREFARTSATILGKSVFLFDADTPNTRPAPGETDTGYDLRSGDPDAADAIVPRDPPASTAVCLIPQNSEGIRKHFYSPQIDTFWESLRQKFDLVVIDSPPFEISPDGLAISRRVDGVVLVLEAEKTRWPVAERLKEQVQSSGGNILGIVFNKRRYHIPEFVYKRI
jgi:Mrp family chromosome partitioning ATPase